MLALPTGVLASFSIPFGQALPNPSVVRPQLLIGVCACSMATFNTSKAVTTAIKTYTKFLTVFIFLLLVSGLGTEGKIISAKSVCGEICVSKITSLT
jgi:hypothetical protein